MLSVCIPTYNYSAETLVTELIGQIAGKEVELLLYDDGSPRELNSHLKKLPHVSYRYLSSNIGRAAIRNLMAREATYDWLLFLDVDSWPNSALVDTYCLALDIHDLTDGHLVVNGGRTYSPKPPTDKSLLLHWHYGTKRESKPPKERQKHPNLSFHSNNFLVHKSILERLPFSEGLSNYGHEDTLWAHKLSRDGIIVHHIDNPVVHLGLEHTAVFLDKQWKSVANLFAIRGQYPSIRTRLTDFVDRYSFLTKVIGLVPEKALRFVTTNQFLSRSLWPLDLLKIKWWSELARKGI